MSTRSPRTAGYIESYNATRGAYRGTGAVVRRTPIRFYDGEKTEDWIAANSKALPRLGRSRPRQGPG